MSYEPRGKVAIRTVKPYLQNKRRGQESVKPTDTEARAVLARQLAQGDTVRESMLRRARLMDVALDGIDALKKGSKQ